MAAGTLTAGAQDFSSSTHITTIPQKTETRTKITSDITKELQFSLINRSNLENKLNETWTDFAHSLKSKTRMGLTTTPGLQQKIHAGLITTLQPGKPVNIAGYVWFVQKIEHGKLECRIKLPLQDDDCLELTLRAKQDLGAKVSLDWMGRLDPETIKSRLDVTVDIHQVEQATIQLLLRLQHDLCIDQGSVSHVDFAPSLGTRVRF